MDKDAIRQVLGEQLLTEIQAIHELVSVIPSMNDSLTRVEGDVVEIKGELVVHRQIFREHSATLQEHSTLLNEHSALLNEHSADLKEIKQIAAGHTEAIAELKASRPH